MAKHGNARNVKVRLYMEGRLVENAFVGVFVRSNVGSTATAQLELVPTNAIKNMLPGTWIHIFTTDPWDTNPAGDLSDYKLLYEGVAVARGFTRREEGRNFVVQCAGPSVYWTNAKQFWLNIADSNGGLVDQLAVQTSGGYGRFGQVATTGTYGYMASKLAFADKDQPEERFMDTLISVLDDIGNVNPYYTNARNRLRITDRIIRGPAGKTEKLFQLALMGDFLEGLAGRVSGQSNLVDVVNQLLTAIMHEWVEIPAPPYIKTRIFDRDIFGNLKRNKKTVHGRGPRGTDTVDLFDVQTAQDAIVGSILFKPHVYTVSPPTCNVLFPNMYEGLQYTENFLADTTRLAMKPQLPLVGAGATMGLLLQRPTELEVFTALVRDPKRSAAGARTPDGKYADGAAQVPNFTDYDWSTNEERIRGIVYNFMNLAPAPSTLTLSDPGKRTPTGAREGGVPKYLQNVASYEWYKSKFASRTTEISGPYNMRPIVGLPILVLDDSPANMTLVANLEGVVHNVQAQGNATTSYVVSCARLLDEVDLNRPNFQNKTKDNEITFDLFRNEDGSYNFDQLFDGKNEPPIPEWFDTSWTNVLDLDVKYRSWFGDKAGVVQNILFKNPGDKPSAEAVTLASSVLGVATGDATFSNVGDAAKAFGSKAEQFLKILAQNENISIQDAATELNARYRKARDQGGEFEMASTLTDRSFTKIDEAFRFIGAGPAELAETGAAGAVSFAKNPAGARSINYKTAKLDLFVGDTSAGSGYSGVPEGSASTTATTSTTQSTGAVVADAISGADPAPPADRMSGAFPIFETKIHTGKEATDASTRSALARGAERAPSDRARYDGRPVMYDFEFRLWQQSLRDAGFSPTGETIAENATTADYFVEDGKGNVVRPKTAEERAASIKARQASIAAQQQRASALKAQGVTNPTDRSVKSPTNADQAPTGDGLEQQRKLPLPQPLSEKQVVDLRRAIIDAYRDELARTRGFSG